MECDIILLENCPSKYRKSSIIETSINAIAILTILGLIKDSSPQLLGFKIPVIVDWNL